MGVGDATSRRAVLLGAGAVGAAGLLAACGGEPEQPRQPAPPGGPGATAGQNTDPPGPAGVPVGQVPVGGGVIDTGRRVVVTQPEAGQFKAFDAVCTHEGCIVTAVTAGMIICACHGSRYRIADGSVAQGPSTRPLPEKTATVDGDRVIIT